MLKIKGAKQGSVRACLFLPARIVVLHMNISGFLALTKARRLKGV